MVMGNTFSKSLVVFAMLVAMSVVGFGTASGYGYGEGEEEETTTTPEVVQERSGGSGGSYRGRTRGLVLGESTSTSNTPMPPMPAICSPYLTTFMRIGQANDAADVTRLQAFLNEHLSKTIPTTGFFGPITEGAVKEFQQKYKDEILTPWGMTAPSGYVYRTTQRKINLIKCPSLDIPLNVAG